MPVPVAIVEPPAPVPAPAAARPERHRARLSHPELSTALAKFNETPPAADYAEHLDSWVNTQTGIGTTRDKVTSTGFVDDGVLSFSDIENMFHNDDVVGRICTQLPELALGQGFALKDPALCKKLEALSTTETFLNAWIFARAYGGTKVLVGFDNDADRATPATGEPTSLLVLDRWSIYAKSYYHTGPKFGRPEIYTVALPPAIGFNGINTALGTGAKEFPYTSQDIHESRLISFPGAVTSPRKKYANGYWDDSVIQRCVSVVRGYGLTWASVIHLLQDVAQGVFHIQGLYQLLLEDPNLVLDRMRTVDEQRSSARSIMLDLDKEKFERTQSPFASVPELIDRMSERLAACAETPITVLMGSSPAGMNATGESDLENWYGRGRKARNTIVTPAVQQLCRYYAPAAEPVDVSYPPFWVPTVKEIADARLVRTQALQILQTIGSIDSQEVRDTIGQGDNAPLVALDPAKTALSREDLAKAVAAPAAGAPATPGSKVGESHFSPVYGR